MTNEKSAESCLLKHFWFWPEEGEYLSCPILKATPISTSNHSVHSVFQSVLKLKTALGSDPNPPNSVGVSLTSVGFGPGS